MSSFRHTRRLCLPVNGGRGFCGVTRASAHLAEAILAFRRIRPEELPSGLFSETGWEYLLELFIADTKGERLTGRTIARRCKASDAVAGRWLTHLCEERLVISEGDRDSLDEVLTLSNSGLDSMEELLARGRALRETMING